MWIPASLPLFSSPHFGLEKLQALRASALRRHGGLLWCRYVGYEGGGSQAGDHAATGGGDTSGRSECLVLGYASFGVLNHKIPKSLVLILRYLFPARFLKGHNPQSGG